MALSLLPLNILIIEDDSIDYLFFHKCLIEEHSGISLKRATSFSQAKTVLQSSGRFDLILLDLTLPDAPEVTEMVREIVASSCKSPIIALTNHCLKDFGVHNLSLGISDFILKDDLTAVHLLKSIHYSIERKKIENQLTESEQKYKSLFDLSPMPMWVLDRSNLKFLNVNAAAIEMYGYTRAEFLKMTVRDLWANKKEPKIEEVILNNKNEVFKVRAIHVTKGGEVISVDVQSNPIVFDGIEARVSLINNISAQLEAENALILSEQRFKALVQDGSDLVMILDFEGHISYASPSAKLVTGISAEKLKQQNFFYIIHEDDIVTVQENIAKLSENKRIQIPSYRIKSAENQWRWIETIITNLTDDPAIQGLVANSRDITDFVFQEKELRDSLKRYDIVAKATSDTITDYNVPEDHMEYNEGIEAMFGYTNCQVEHTGSWWHEKIHPEDRDRVKCLISEVYTKGQPQMQIEYRFRCADGSYKFVLDRSYMVKDESGNPHRMIGSMQDITELRNYIQTIEEHNKRLKEIAWTQSHVVRAPLARIMGLIDLLQNHDDIEDVQLLLKSILSSARELDQIIRKISSKTEDAKESIYKC